MKKLLHGLTGLVVIFLPLIWGGLLIYGNGFNNTFRDSLFVFFQDSPLSGIGVGMLLLLIGLIYLGTFGRPRPRVRTISFESESGAVSIDVKAVSDFIRKLGDEFGAIISMEPRVSSNKDMITIDLDVRIQTGTRIPELSQLVQERVRDSIRDGLGIVDVREVKVHVREIVGAPPPSHRA